MTQLVNLNNTYTYITYHQRKLLCCGELLYNMLNCHVIDVDLV